MNPPPLLLVLDAVAARRAFVRTHLAPLGWVVAEAAEGIPESAEATPALVLLDPAWPDATGVVGRFGGTESGVPVLAFAGEGDPALPVDGVVAWPCTPAALVAAIRPWQPAGITLDRLAAVFGAERLAGLLADFDAQLGDALDRIDEGDTGLAHRIGGLAGTLGFARVSAAWLAMSEGDEAAVTVARAGATAAREAIGRWRANAGHGV